MIIDNMKYVNTNYLVGLPSGQIIDIDYKEINNLKQDGFIVYSGNILSYTFDDNDYEDILKSLKRIETGSIHEIMKFFDNQKRITNYMFLPNGRIEVSGDVYISGVNGGMNLKLPFKFNKVSGDFTFRNCNLKWLEGSPIEVGGDFDVSGNDLYSLLGGPKKVGGLYDCSNNSLNSLEGSPELISGYFDCS